MPRRRTTVTIRAADLQRIDSEALAALPEEGCGVLVGERMAGQAVRVTRVVSARNAHRGDRQRRFAIDPSDLVAAHKRARAEGFEVVGYWHSHPRGAARPSERDRLAAWPGESHLIIALAEGRVSERRCWRLLEDGGDFAEEEIRYSRATGVASAPVDGNDERDR